MHLIYRTNAVPFNLVATENQGGCVISACLPVVICVLLHFVSLKTTRDRPQFIMPLVTPLVIPLVTALITPLVYAPCNAPLCVRCLVFFQVTQLDCTIVPSFIECKYAQLSPGAVSQGYQKVRI